MHPHHATLIAAFVFLLFFLCMASLYILYLEERGRRERTDSPPDNEERQPHRRRQPRWYYTRKVEVYWYMY
jgi:hypothetical protein